MNEQEHEWIVTVDSDHIDQIDQVAAELETTGFRVDRVMYSIGQISGCTRRSDTGEEIGRSQLTVVTGVVSVDAVRQYRVRPPDSEVQ